MNRIFIKLLLGCFFILYTHPSVLVASTPVVLDVYIEDPTEILNPRPKSPIIPPSVSLDDHILYFDTPCDGCTLNIVDENDLVVYTTVIPTGTTSLVLPSTLSGEYIIEIIRGNYCFWGLIEF